MYEEINVKTVLIEITNICNLNCIHCYNSCDRTKFERVFMPLSKIKYIIEKCYKYNLLKLYISGGEPLCHPDIIKIIRLCRNYPSIFFTITTNGLLLTKELILEIEKSSNICIQISVDGLTQETYEKMRGDKTFALFKKALNQLINSKARYLTARTCITRINYREVPIIYEYLLEHKIMPSFLFVNQMGNAAKNWENLYLDLSMQLRILNDINCLNKKHEMDITPPEPVSTCNFTEKVEVKSLLIKYDGNIAPCQFFYSDTIGNIFSMDISKILSLDNLHYYYELAEKRKKSLEQNKKCQKCSINSICSYGCLGLANSRGNPLGIDGQCTYRIITCALYSNRIIAGPKQVNKEHERHEII